MTNTEFRQRADLVEKLLATRPLIRAINFHLTPRSRQGEYERQLEHWRQHFAPVTEDDLDGYLRSGRWSKPKPGLIVALYEGYRDHFDVYLPLLERFGFVGWFFVITEFVKARPAEQMRFAQQHDISTIPGEYADGRVALTWDELRVIDRKHVVASHARTHTKLSDLTQDLVESEVAGSQRDLVEFLGHPVRSFVSYSGPAYGEYAPADRLIDAAGYQFVFSNYQIQRIMP